jgi:hypothetical protein
MKLSRNDWFLFGFADRGSEVCGRSVNRALWNRLSDPFDVVPVVGSDIRKGVL